MQPILTLTMNPTVDLSTSVENIFPNHKLRCGAVSHYPGGGGINVSRAIKRLGGESLAIHCSGGPMGLMLNEMLSAECISHRKIEISGWTRENFTVSENSTGQQYRFVTPGPTMQESEWRAVLDMFAALKTLPEYLVASGSLPLGVPDNFYGRLARIVKGKHCRLIVDTSGPPLEAAVREGVFLIKPSLRELQVLTGKKLKYESEQQQAAMDLITSERCEVVVLSLGPGGMLAASAKGCKRMRAPTVSVHSRVGAGDCMVAGIVLGLFRKHSLLDAVRYGGAAGTAAVMNPGTELCHREDVEHLFSKCNQSARKHKRTVLSEVCSSYK